MFKRKFIDKILKEGGYFVAIYPKVPRCCPAVEFVFLHDSQGYFVSRISERLFWKYFESDKLDFKYWLSVDEVGSVFSYYYSAR